MTDLARLTEALESWDDYKGIVWQQVADESFAAITRSMEAARLVVDGQDVEWCETHHSPMTHGEFCQYAELVYTHGDCRMVSARLVFPKAEEKKETE